ncbi:MAG: protein translocase subunit SecD [Acidimicrobiales bacterium]
MRKWSSALFVMALTIVAGLYTAVSGNEPLLGLDLQGGVSVVLQPTGPADEEALNQSLEIIRSRVDSLGVAEPEISLQGETIVVDLPGVQEQQRALDLVGQTAELRFRPVLFDLGPDLTSLDGVVGDADDATSTTTTAADDVTSDDATSTSAADAGNEESLGLSGGRLSPLAPTQDATSTTVADGDPTLTTVADGDPTSTTAADGDTTATTAAEDPALDPAQQAIVDACIIPGVTPPEEDVGDRPVVLADENGNRVCLGPTLLTGEALETADVSLGPTGQWTVNPVFEAGAGGIDAFNAAAFFCYVQNPDPEVCPSGRLAIVLDHRVVSSPSINAPSFGRDQITISGTFDEDGARDLAAVLRFGALPVELETQQTRTVSATIGDDVLRAGVISGLVGLALVAIYLLALYRLAGLVAILGLVISAVLLWSIVAWFGEYRGLALTLAGVVGLVVSVGVSADSNIVYFESVKDAYRNGRRMTTAVERAYRGAISTIVKADMVSLIAAGLLYFLTVGAVRGFAFYLGLATLLDLFISWLFMRPALAFLAERRVVQDRPGLLGLPSTGGQS